MKLLIGVDWEAACDCESAALGADVPQLPQKTAPSVRGEPHFPQNVGT
ncbi:MAG: hypothetical protein ABI064_04560 [Acidobacteriaceae bacterium]